MRIYDIGAGEGSEAVRDRVLTVPNVLSFVRLLALPWIYVDLTGGRHARALVVLGVFAATDWLDGYLARRLGQVTRLGKILDPVSDRLLIIVVGIGMIVADLIPVWAVVVLVVRDVVVLSAGLAVMRQGRPPPAVTRIGKTATFGLMVALPLLILASVLGDGPDAPHGVVRGLAWVTYATHTVLYYVSAGQYGRQILAGDTSGSPPVGPGGDPGPDRQVR